MYLNVHTINYSCQADKGGCNYRHPHRQNTMRILDDLQYRFIIVLNGAFTYIVSIAHRIIMKIWRTSRSYTSTLHFRTKKLGSCCYRIYDPHLTHILSYLSSFTRLLKVLFRTMPYKKNLCHPCISRSLGHIIKVSSFRRIASSFWSVVHLNSTNIHTPVYLLLFKTMKQDNTTVFHV
jgi:hypothetical protein